MSKDIDVTALRPGSLATPNEKRSVVSTPDLIAIQVFVDSGKRLPTTAAQFRSFTNFTGAFTAPLPDLINEYVTLNQQALDWEGNIYPAIVGLADDIFHYSQRVDTFYPPLIEISDKWSGGDTPTTADMNRYIALLTALAKVADTKATTANTVNLMVKAFAKKLSDDDIVLKRLKDDLDKVFSDQGTIITQALKDIKDDSDALDAANADYHRDVVVAATTPTYAWVPYVGLITAAIFAGVYGDLAVKALNKIKELTALKDTADAAQQAALLVQADYSRVSDGVNKIIDKVTNAADAIAKIEGVWSAIASDVSEIVKTLKEADINNPDNLPILASDELKLALTEWQDVGQKADQFRAVAFIQAPPIQAANTAAA